ncbi:hypothetical protein EXIGLDRAFT_719112 [Exidia glandulosa HHB12029]|uniref:Uncharacterized protein n=1 Tax=Exidia glandulosa HHB12029 TaxID=1314781 RepID=A0A165HBJ2_EXIGL|nr:hypothetical protein EXIGLDRAFT_719112 [Exidia glandulosa HHB12029]
MSSKPRPTKYSVIKDGWGSRPNFQYSYGLKMTPEDLEEGEEILNQLLKNAIADWEDERKQRAGQSNVAQVLGNYQ